MARLLSLPYPLHLVNIFCLESPPFTRLLPCISLTSSISDSRAADISAKAYSSDDSIPGEMVEGIEDRAEDDTGKDGEDISAD